MNLKKCIPKVGKMKLHELKIKSEYACPKLVGLKPFEIRLNDRDYHVGDIVHYICPDNDSINAILKEKFYQIIFMTSYMQQENYIVYAERELKEVK